MSRDELEHEVDAFIDAQRVQALWFAHRDWYPATDEERRRALAQIQRRANRETYVRARKLAEWLSLDSKHVSADS